MEQQIDFSDVKSMKPSNIKYLQYVDIIKYIKKNNEKNKKDLNKFFQQQVYIQKLKECLFTKKCLEEKQDKYVLTYKKRKYCFDTDDFELVKKNVFVSKKAVDNLFNAMKLNITSNGGMVGYRDIAKTLIFLYKLDIDIEEFNGGKNRAKYMFPYYYYPLQVLKIQGVVCENDKKQFVFCN